MLVATLQTIAMQATDPSGGGEGGAGRGGGGDKAPTGYSCLNKGLTREPGTVL